MEMLQTRSLATDLVLAIIQGQIHREAQAIATREVALTLVDAQVAVVAQIDQAQAAAQIDQAQAAVLIDQALAAQIDQAQAAQIDQAQAAVAQIDRPRAVVKVEIK